MSVSPLYPPHQYFITPGSTTPAAGYQLFFYQAGTSTKEATYTDSAGGTPNANPIVLDADGTPPAGIYGTVGTSYKVVLAPDTDTDPPASGVTLIDNYYTGDQSLRADLANTTDQTKGFNLIAIARTDAEISAGITPTNYQYPELDCERYGADISGVSDSHQAITDAIAVAEQKVVAQPDATGDYVDGAFVKLRGKLKITDVLRIAASNVGLLGDPGTTILPYFTSSAGYNGAKPAIIVGTAESWQNSGSITGTTKYNVIDNLKIVRTAGQASFIGILVSGTRNLNLSNFMAEEGYCGVYLENTSEMYASQIASIGCVYGMIMDNRGSRAAGSSVLNVANFDNDVSSNKFDQITMYYPQHTGILMLNCGTTNINNGTIGLFSNSPIGSPALGLPTAAAGIHISGGLIASDTKWLRGSLVDELVFEAYNTASSDCILLTSSTSNGPILGVTFNSCHIQTYASQQSTAGNITTFVKATQSSTGDIRHVVFNDCGFTYQSAGYYYGNMCNLSGAVDIRFNNCFPTVAFATSTAVAATTFGPIQQIEKVNIDAFPPTGWSTLGTTTGCSKTGGATGTPAALKFTGDAGIMAVTKTITTREIKQDIKTVFISFLARGDSTLYLKARINGDNATATDVISGTTQGMYSQALYKNTALTATYTRWIWVIKPNDVGYGFDRVDFWLGRAADAVTTNYSEIFDIKIGFFEGLTEVFNPF